MRDGIWKACGLGEGAQGINERILPMIHSLPLPLRVVVLGGEADAGAYQRDVD